MKCSGVCGMYTFTPVKALAHVNIMLHSTLPNHIFPCSVHFAVCYREDLEASCLCFHSAGVGRTGTFIVIDSMIDMMHIEQRVDVFGFVSRIREQRCQLIQTDVSIDPFRPVVPWTDSSTRCSGHGINKRGHRKQQCLWCKNSGK